MTQIIPSRGGGGGVGLYKYMGTVDYYEDLPTSGMKVGDTYNVVNAHTTAPEFPAGANLAWNGEEWDVLGGTFDLSEYQKKLIEGDGIDIDQDTNEISVESSVIEGAAAGATAVQPGDDVSELVNDAGYLVSSDLKQSDWGQTDSSAIDYIKNKPTIGNGTLTVSRNGVQVNTFSANQTSNSCVDISVPTKTSDIQNDSGYIDKTVSNLDNYTLSSNLCAVATSGKYCDLSGRVTDNCQIANGCGYITSAALSPYAKCTDIPTDNCQLANGCGYTTCTGTLVPSDLSPYAKCTDIPTDNCQLANGCGYITGISSTDVTDALGYTPYNSTNPNGYTTCTGTLVASDLTPYAKTCDISCVGKTNQYCDLTGLPTIPGVIDSLTSSCTNQALSAKQGCVLNSCVSEINGKIPSTATTSNQLADKAFVNSSINALAAFYITKNAAGDQFDTYAELIGTTTYYSGGVVRVPTTNDYAIVKSDENHSGETTRYSYQTSQWEYQYTVNETPLTQCQLDALNSGITSAKVSTYDGYATSKQDVSNMVCTLSGADNSHYPSAKAVADALSCAGAGDMLKSVYDPNNCNTDAFNYNNLYNKPTIPTDNCQLANSCGYTTCTGTVVASDLTPYALDANVIKKTSSSGSQTVCTTASGCTTAFGVKSNATSSYISLNNCSGWLASIGATNDKKPTWYNGTGHTLAYAEDIPTNNNQLTNGCGYTTCTGTVVASDLTPYAKTCDLAAVATSGKYCDLTGTPSLCTVATSGKYCDLTGTPTIGTATLTIQKNGTTVNTFGANATSNVTANITVPTDTGDLTNGAGFITGISSGDVTTALGYTPYNSSNPSGYTTCTGTITQVCLNGASCGTSGGVNICVNQVPSGGTEGQVLTKTSTGCCWADPQGGGGSGMKVDYILVGGGGGAGYAGGGGGGGLLNCRNKSISAGSYSVIVGGGGTGYNNSSCPPGENGGDSSFLGDIAYGGGGGGGFYNQDCGRGRNGGSGGGNGGSSSCNCQNFGGLGIHGQGNMGGCGCRAGNSYYGGGGGGAGGPGNGWLCYCAFQKGKGGEAGLVRTPSGCDEYYSCGGFSICGAACYTAICYPYGDICGGGGNGGGCCGKSMNGLCGIVKIYYKSDGSCGFSSATGGTVTTEGNYKVHTFTSNGTFTIVS